MQDRTLAPTRVPEIPVAAISALRGTQSRQVFEILLQHGPLRFSDLAKILAVASNTLANRMKPLKREGLIEQRGDMDNIGNRATY